MMNINKYKAGRIITLTEYKNMDDILKKNIALHGRENIFRAISEYNKNVSNPEWKSYIENCYDDLLISRDTQSNNIFKQSLIKEAMINIAENKKRKSFY